MRYAIERSLVQRRNSEDERSGRSGMVVKGEREEVKNRERNERRGMEGAR